MHPKSKPIMGVTLPLLLLILYALFVASYSGLRFSGHWQDVDSVRLTTSSQAIYDRGRLTTSQSYPFGYTYPALNAFLSYLTGIPVVTLQIYVQPFLIALLVPVAFIAFRGLAGELSVAVLATLFLFCQPEFLFEVTRSSHAKITWIMALSMLFIITASFRSAKYGRVMIKWVLLFYLVTYAAISSNSFLASNYIFGITFAFLGGVLLFRWGRVGLENAKHLHRLYYVALSCGILVFLFMFYIYQPSLNQFTFLNSIWDKFAALFLDLEVAYDPYNYVAITWIHKGIYLTLTILNWFLLVISFLAWLQMAYKMITWREQFSAQKMLLWLLYAAFAVLLVISVTLDYAGALSGNLQVRIFPNFMITAIPLASMLIMSFLGKLQKNSRKWFNLAISALVLSFVLFSGGSLLKITNEPVLSNHWTFNIPAEKQAMVWGGDHIENREVWVGADSRLVYLSLTIPSWVEHKLSTDQGYIDSQTSRYFMESQLSTGQAARMGALLPNFREAFKVYDNGQVVYYKTRPQTPYQR